MNLKYYVLASENNITLKYYLKKYRELLTQRLEFIFNFYDKKDLELYLWDEILSWDNSSQINYIFFEIKSGNNPNEKFEIFIKNYFSKNDKSDLIENTNIYLTLNDKNPYNNLEAHPDHKKSWGVMWYWEKEVVYWKEIYKNTFEILRQVDFWFYQELNLIIQKIVPLWTAFEMHNSASYKECIWHLYLWLTLWVESPEFMNLEAIIHESSHNKLNLIMHFDEVILNNNEEIYYSAIRPDARHMKWVLLWIHAFAPTMYIMVKSILSWVIKTNENLDTKIALYYIKTKLLYKVLEKYGIFSEIWKEIFEEIWYVVKLLDIDFKKLNISKMAILEAKKMQDLHFKNVNNNYSYLRY